MKTYTFPQIFGISLTVLLFLFLFPKNLFVLPGLHIRSLFLIGAVSFFLLDGAKPWRNLTEDRIGKLLLSLFVWLLVVSLTDGFFGSEYYRKLIATHGLEGIFLTYEFLPFNAILLFLLIRHLALSKHNLPPYFLPGCYVGLYCIVILGGFYRYFDERMWFTGEHLVSFNVYYNVTAMFLNLFVPIFLALFLMDKRLWIRWMSGLFYVFGTVCIVLTQSRGGIVTLFISSVLILGSAFIFHRNQRTVISISLIVLIIIIAGGLLPAEYTSSMYDRFTKKDLVTFAERKTLIWPSAERLIWNNPISGYALGTFPVKHFQDSKQARKLYNKSNRLHADTHNQYLQVIYNGGIIGFLLYLSFFYEFFRTTLHRYINKSGNPPIDLAIFITGISCFFVYGNIEAYALSWLTIFSGFYYLVHSQAYICD